MKCRFSECAIKDNRLFFWDINTGLYAFLDLDNMRVSYIDVYGMNLFKERSDAVCYMNFHDDTLVSVSNDGRYIGLIDTEENKGEKIEIDCHYKQWGNFSYCELKGENLYLFLREKKQIVKINVISKEMMRLDVDIAGEVTFVKGVRYGAEKALLITNDNRYGIFSYNSDEFEYFGKSPILRIMDIDTNQNGDVYILSEEGDLFLSNIMMDNITNAKHISRIGNGGDKKYLFATDTGAFVLPNSNEGIIYSVNNNGKIIEEIQKSFNFDSINWAVFKGKCVDRDRTYIASRSCDGVIIIDNKELKLDICDYEVDKGSLVGVLKNNGQIIREDFVGLNEFISMMIN